MDKLLQKEELKFVTIYFKEHHYKVIRVDQKENRIHVLTKNLKYGNNETFEISGGELKKLIHNKRDKRHPWQWKRVARQTSRRNYLHAMRAAVNKNFEQ